MRRRGGDRGRLVTDSATFAQVRTDLQCSVRSKGGFHIISTLVQSLIGAEPAAVYSWSSGQVSDRVQLLHLHSSSTTNSGHLPSSILLLSNLPSSMKKCCCFGRCRWHQAAQAPLKCQQMILPLVKVRPPASLSPRPLTTFQSLLTFRLVDKALDR